MSILAPDGKQEEVAIGRGTLALVPLPPGTLALRVRLELQAPDRPAAGFETKVILPNSLPRILGLAPCKEGKEQPRIRVTDDGGLRLWGAIAAAEEGKGVSQPTFLQIMLGTTEPGGAIEVSPMIQLRLRNVLRRQLGPEASRLTLEITSALTFFDLLFSTPEPLTVVAGLPEDFRGMRRVPSGACCVIRSGEELVEGRGSFGLPFGVLRQLATAWWGGGVRLAGKSGPSVERGVALSAALYRLEVTGRDLELRIALDKQHSIARTGRARRLWERVNGYMDPVTVGRTSVRLLATLRDHASGSQVMRGRTTTDWGRWGSPVLLT
ncbi:MAG: hypothetical protein IPK12_18635 [Gemmatimonadetes bacterium]|nr:hypothetical protein [Gemmatimonadota bacterium]